MVNTWKQHKCPSIDEKTKSDIATQWNHKKEQNTNTHEYMDKPLKHC